MHKAKLIKIDGDQAVKLPREFYFKGKEVFIKKTPEGVLLSERDPWDLFLEGIKEISPDFMAERRQPKIQRRKMR